MTASDPSALLAVEAIVKRFGGVIAVNGVSFSIGERAVVGLIGPNGSGKTTLLNMVNGVFAPDRGEIRMSGSAIAGKRPSDLSAIGLSRTFQTARVFQTLTVVQNLFVPLLHQQTLERSAASQRAMELLTFVGLQGHAERAASELSGGQQRLLEFARALVTKPRIVLMDEPFAGVHPEIKSLLIGCIRQTVDRDGTSFLIVSHEVPDLVAMSDSMICLVEGAVAASGAPTEVVRDEKVVEGYLGHG